MTWNIEAIDERNNEIKIKVSNGKKHKRDQILIWNA